MSIISLNEACKSKEKVYTYEVQKSLIFAGKSLVFS